MADLLGRIERLLEDAVEGTSRRIFGAELQPVELAKAASRAMQAWQVVGPDGPEVPNRYRILLHPGDFRRFASYRNSLEGKLVAYLDRFAADRGLRPVAPWHVEVVADQGVRSRSVVVDAQMADPAERPAADAQAAADLVESIGPGRDRSPPHQAPPAATLVTEDGGRLTLGGASTTIGRALDNDVVIADARVSRYHAEVRRAANGYLVRDLKSTNGTAVAGKRVVEQLLADGDEISLGGYILTIRFESD